MDKETINDSENINSDEWKFLLLMMLTEDIKQKNSQWKSFEDELIYKNRFSVKHAVIDEIHECQANAVTIRKKDTVLYRARVFEKSNFNRLVKYYLQESGYSKSDIEKILNEWTDEQKILSLMPEIYSDYDYNQTPELVKAQKKWKRYVKYKGWNAEDSGAPPADLIGNGRANPDHIRYLYLSEDPVTPVYEVRPIIGDTVSVAKFKLLKDVRLYDLTFDIHDIENDEVVELPRLYNTIGAMFSRPYNGDMPYLNEEIIYSLRNCLLHQSTPNVEQSKIHESRCKVDKFELVITGEDGANGDLSMVAYGKDMNIVRRELQVPISHLCYILCTAAEDYYKNNKEKFDFIKYSIEDDRPKTFL